MRLFRSDVPKADPPRDASAIAARAGPPRDASRIRPPGRDARAIAAKPSPAQALGKTLAAKATDIDLVRKAVDDASTFVRGLWVTFVTLGVYLLMSAGSVTHHQLFLETPIKLPLLDVQLPLVAFFVIAPAIFLIFHVYLLLQIGLLSGKVGRFNELVAEANLDGAIETDLRRLLPNDVLVQYLAGPDDKRLGRAGKRGVAGQLMRLTTWITMVLGPLAVLLFIQLRFLPYQDEWVTCWQRACVVLDIIVLALLWRRVASRSVKPLVPWIIKAAATFAMSVALIAFSCLAMTFPGEQLDDTGWSKYFHDWAVRPLEYRGESLVCWDGWQISSYKDQLLFFFRDPFPLWAPNGTEGERDWLVRMPAARRVIPATLRLYGDTLVPRDQLDKLATREPDPDPGEGQRLVSARRRKLVGADISYADLSRADLREADMMNVFANSAKLDHASIDSARLEFASLDNARLDRASLVGATLDDASLINAELKRASFTLAKLRRASLKNANFQGSIMNHAQLQNANLESAQMSGAYFFRAQLDGARLLDANLQSAKLATAELPGALLDGARLEGASLAGAKLYGASLDGAKLRGAIVLYTHLEGASLNGAELQGATLISAKLQGASLYRAQLQGALLNLARLSGARISKSLVYRTRFRDASLTFVTGIPSSKPVYYEPLLDFNSEPIPLTDNVVKNWIDGVSEAVSDDDQKSQMRGRFDRLLGPEKTEDIETINFEWRIGNDKLTAYATFLGALACDTRTDQQLGALTATPAPYLARGLIRNKRIQAARTEAKSVADRLRAGKTDPVACPGVVGFTNEDWSALDNAVLEATLLEENMQARPEVEAVP